TVGIWLSNENEKLPDGKINRNAEKNKERNQREISRAIELAKRHRNVNAIIVGNETVLRGDKTVDEMIEIVEQVKRQSPVPVTTGETHDQWLGRFDANSLTPEGLRAAQEKAEKIPKLAAAVDYIAVHILPYWDKVSANQAVDHTLRTYEELRRAYPGKRIV